MFRHSFLCSSFSKHFCVVHSVVIVCARYIHLLFKLLLKFRNISKHTEHRSALACNRNIKKRHPHSIESFALLWSEIQRNDITDPPLKPPALNAPVTSAEKLGTNSKHNVRGITLDIRPIWWIHSLTLITSSYCAFSNLERWISINYATISFDITVQLWHQCFNVPRTPEWLAI